MYSVHTVLVPSSPRTQYVSNIKTGRFVQYIEINVAYCDNLMKHIHALCGKMQSILVLSSWYM